MHILGISCFYHDAAAALLRDGVLVAAAEEERFTRKKHDFGFPRQAIHFCLEQGGISSQDLDFVVFYEKPFIKLERLLLTALSCFPRAGAVFRDGMGNWLLDKLWVKNTIQKELRVTPGKVLFCEHHLSHAASAFFCSPFEEAAILTADGVGEWTTTAMGVARDNRITLNHEIRFPHSIGLLYSAFTAFLGFEVNEGEYKVMGMSAYGTPRYVDKVLQVVEMAEDGSFRLNMDYFCFHYSTQRTFNSKFESLFGPARDPRQRDILEPYYADVAASLQYVTEELMLRMAHRLHRETGLSQLCLAGGVALNSVANGRMLRETPFTQLFVPPAAGDGGGALGAALYAHHATLNQPRKFVMEHAYWGQEHGAAQIEEALKQVGIHYERLSSDADLLERTVARLAEGKAVGWMQGRFEFGPRALGHRSILADPRRPEMKDIVNRKIKFREPFRPFAPSVVVEETDKYFELPDAASHFPARFMLLVVPVKEAARSVIPAVTHADGSARPQVVHRQTSPLYHRLISLFGEATGVGVVLNTSFNLKGEPIVNTPAEALSTFMRSGLDVLVMDHHWVEKEAR